MSPLPPQRWGDAACRNGRFAGCRRLSGHPALVAQRIEHLTTDQKVGGSSPSERAQVTGQFRSWDEPFTGPCAATSAAVAAVAGNAIGDVRLGLLGLAGQAAGSLSGLAVGCWAGMRRVANRASSATTASSASDERSPSMRALAFSVTMASAVLGGTSAFSS